MEMGKVNALTIVLTTSLHYSTREFGMDLTGILYVLNNVKILKDGELIPP